MAKFHPAFACQSCGAVYNRWRGKCEACGGWNTVVEETGAGSALAGPAATRPSRARGRVFPLQGLAGEAKDPPRTRTGIAEFDRVAGGGLVPGSVILIGGPLDINEVGRRAGTIGYEILTRLGRRYARHYIGD